MESLTHFAQGFQALGSESRLLVYITLLQHHPEGLNIKDLQAKVEIKASTLAHHLKVLVDAGFVQQQQRGKENFNYAITETLQTLCDNISCKCCEYTKR
ncbi:hypothetical protein BBW65_00175 [Helicobacter enhydrae]|uniref:HTH arsR-type domain-containing protein n=1 Tax=Helicobacter enhydrae TaxID=222136 RepID=A0A1B1U3N0_9HELI|nr:winged helix-turn-helix domain-containing protein [Helicobacter enhydrae]ANV97332.1 hypothetical protein BBW65_00175 [Helicobacter enhydrae]